MSLRATLAVDAGKLAGIASRLGRRGGGTAITGLVAERVHPGLLRELGRQLPGVTLVSGTNGKTTTTRLLASILAAAGTPFVTNRTGSNLARGVTGSLVAAAGPLGRLRLRASSGLFEVDEASLPAVARALQPTVLVFTNLFRDQLDRYGEVDTVAALWREALAASPPDATLVLNADDPSVAALADGWRGPVHWFGVDDASFASAAAGASDARWCQSCGGAFGYGLRFFAPVGHWRCEGCGRGRVPLGTSATAVAFDLDSARFVVTGLGGVTLQLTGLYNVYNALAAIAAARVLAIEPAAVLRGLSASEAAFGRQERVVYRGRTLRILLCKNPAGANQVMLLLAALARQGKGPLAVAAMLNDGFADGQDVSWIWDVDFEALGDSVSAAFSGGVRAADMALRLTYAGWPSPIVAESPSGLLEALVSHTPAGADIFVMATYTAMLGLRAQLAREGAVTPFWEG